MTPRTDAPHSRGAVAVRALWTGVAVLLLCILGASRVRDPLAGWPRTMLWAWERPERLDFLDPHDTGVAFLASTVSLHGDAASVAPRMQPLRVPPAVRLIAVVRIETRAAALNVAQRDAAVAAIVQASRLPHVAAVQVDFDATASQRLFYRDLLGDLRRQLAPGTPISITALASWCMYDDWISTLPIDEAVPMLFRMGTDQRNIQQYLASGQDFRPAVCRHSLGLSTDESVAHLPAVRRIYWFNPHSWNEAALQHIGGDQ